MTKELEKIRDTMPHDMEDQFIEYAYEYMEGVESNGSGYVFKNKSEISVAYVFGANKCHEILSAQHKEEIAGLVKALEWIADKKSDTTGAHSMRSIETARLALEELKKQKENEDASKRID